MSKPKRSLRRNRASVPLGELIPAVNEAVTCFEVLEHADEYDTASELTRKDDGFAGVCPIGEHRSTSCFRLYEETNSYCCFACRKEDVRGHAGDVVALYAWLYDISQSVAARELAEIFDVRDLEHTKKASRESSVSDDLEMPKAVAPPDFRVSPVITQRLKNLDPHHDTLADFPIPGDVLEHFGAGVDTGRGQMRGRLVCPVENADGELVTHAGLHLESGVWRFYTQYEEYVGADLYNFRRDLDATVVLCSWPDDVWRHYVAGEPPFLPVAIFGDELSAEQEVLLVDRDVVPLTIEL